MISGEPRVLLDGLAIGESPRWHDGRLWFSNWGTDEIVAVDHDGNSEVMGRGAEGLGWAVNWLPDGRMLITGSELIRVDADGSRVRHADLSDISPYGWSEMTVDGRGNVYVNTINFDFADFNEVLTSGQAPGKIALVTPTGDAREVADGLAFPNGMVVTPENETLIVSESFAARLTAFGIAEDGTLTKPPALGRRGGPGRHLPRRRRLHLDIYRAWRQRLRSCPRRRRGPRAHPARSTVLCEHARGPGSTDSVHARRRVAWQRERGGSRRGANGSSARGRRAGTGRRLAVVTTPRVTSFQDPRLSPGVRSRYGR